MNKIQLLSVAILLLITSGGAVQTANALPNTRDEFYINTTHSLHDSIITNTTIPQVSGQKLYALDNQGRLWGAYSSNKTVYVQDSDGTIQLVETFANPVNGIMYTNNGSLIVGTGADWDEYTQMWQSYDDGATFTNVLNFNTNDTYPAVFASSYGCGKVLLGEYDNSTSGSRYVYLSQNDGQSFSPVFTSPSSFTGVHIHIAKIDPYTCDLYVSYGDSYTDLVKSSDNGATWSHFGWIDRYTSILFEQDRVLLGTDHDRLSIRSYNRTTGENKEISRIESPYIGNYFTDTLRVNGVTYLLSTGNPSANITAGLFISTNDRDYYKIRDNNQVYGINTSLVRLANNSEYLYILTGSDPQKINLITEDEANELIYSGLSNRTLALDPQYYSFYQRPLTNASITVYGANVTNYLTNYGFEDSFTGWTSGLLNATYDISTSVSHSGSKSLHIAANNTSLPAYRGKVYSTAYNDAVNLIPAGTNISISLYVKMNSSMSNTSGLIQPYVCIADSIKWANGTSAFQSCTQVYHRVVTNTSDGWIRLSRTDSYLYDISFIQPQILLYQPQDVWIDDVQVQLGDVSPTISGSVNTTGSISINGQVISFDNLTASNTTNLTSNLTNLVSIYPNLSANKYAKVNVSGDPILYCSDCLVEWDGIRFNFINKYNIPNVTIYENTSVELDLDINYSAINTSVNIGNFNVFPNSYTTMNYTFSVWNTSSDYRKLWNESSTTSSITTNHIIGNFPSNTAILIKKNGANWNITTSNSTGYIAFNYTDGYSDIQFETELAPETSSTSWDSYRNDTSFWEILGGLLEVSAVISIVVFIIGALKGAIHPMKALMYIAYSIITMVLVYELIPIIGSIIGQI